MNKITDLSISTASYNLCRELYGFPFRSVLVLYHFGITFAVLCIFML